MLTLFMVIGSNVLRRFDWKSFVKIDIVVILVIGWLFLKGLPCEAHDPLEPKWTKTELTALLKKSAHYYKTLQTTPIHYFCHQEISETLNDFPPYQHYREKKKYAHQLQSKTDLRYDYQILKKSGYLKELRILVERNGKKVRIEHPRLKIRFKEIVPSLTSAAQVLAAERQADYHFKLVERFNDKRGEILVLNALPIKEKRSTHNEYKVWLLSSSGAAIRMEVDERQVPGYHKLVLPLARKTFSVPLLKVTYHFDVSHKGIQYPSKMEIRETFSGGADFHQKFEEGWFLRFTGEFTFKDYHFFNIDVEPRGGGGIPQSL